MGLLRVHAVIIWGRVMVSTRVPEFLQREMRQSEAMLCFEQGLMRLDQPHPSGDTRVAARDMRSIGDSWRGGSSMAGR